ncbi:MAG: sigma-54 dependent transcriptional regulator [Pseudomonadota bacterium]
MGKVKTILVVDDDAVVRQAVRALLAKDLKSYYVLEAENYEQAMDTFQKNEISLALVDIHLGDGNKTGIDLLDEFRRTNSTLPVIIISNSSDAETVIKCMRLGAQDYILKQNLTNYDDLIIKIHNCFNKEKVDLIVKEFERTFDQNYPIIFQSHAMKQILDDIKVADEMNILIEGETGVGKTPIAKYANALAAKEHGSPRAFVRINCAGLSSQRLQADLFGHKKGSFTGAISDNKGLVELAKDGDLFLDEIADMDPVCQAELLTFLDSGEYRRLGDPVVRHSNCRIISASNANLKSKVEQGAFRKDLYSRLSQYKINVPPLRNRKEDVKPILEYYINKFCGHNKPYSPRVLEVCMGHDWMEGNVRELRDAVQYMCVKSRNEKDITTDHMSSNYYFDTRDIREVNIDSRNMKTTIMDIGYDNYIANLEKMVLAGLINEEKSVRGLSKKINLTDMTLGRKLKKYNISIN